MGNRGKLLPRHFERDKPFAIKSWITCVLKDKNNQPLPKSNVKYTRLFFLDEVTAFAAGHRPCGQCQKKRHSQFLDIWCEANQRERKQADQVLHEERVGALNHAIGQVNVAQLEKLPSGTFVQIEPDGQPHLLLLGRLFPWTVQGYLAPTSLPEATVVQVLTPMSIVRTFQAGFPLPFNSAVTVHPSVMHHFV